mmetsp:Transcript_8142/g.15335  ORF Transcript_8142/g.15335 Transcript_8142/m.15335 type:complete len:202 (+) Transcript_8142:336-941(+)
MFPSSTSCNGFLFSGRFWTSPGTSTAFPTSMMCAALRPRCWWSSCCGGLLSVDVILPVKMRGTSCVRARTRVLALLGGESPCLGLVKSLALGTSITSLSMDCSITSFSLLDSVRDFWDSKGCFAVSFPAVVFLRWSSSFLRSNPMFANSISRFMVAVVTVISASSLSASPISCRSSSGTSAIRSVTSRSSRLPWNRFLRFG